MPTVTAGTGGAAGRAPAEAARDAPVLLDDAEDLRGEQVLNYARHAAA